MISPTPKSTSDLGKFNLCYKPLTGSNKIYKPGKVYNKIRVPFREIKLSPTIDGANNKIHNTPVLLYDTSGPYSDPMAAIDISKGLDELRRPWLIERNDVDILEKTSSFYRLNRVADKALDEIRFPHPRKPLRARPGRTRLSSALQWLTSWKIGPT